MKLIVACDPLGGIGYNNKLPWSNIQGDLPRFKRLTEGHIIVMGRNTWESLPKKPLPNRINVVVTSKDLPDVTTINSISHQFYGEYPDAWMIGGAQLINTSWHLIDEVHLTRTFTEYTCDSFIDIVQLKRMYVLIHEEVNEDHVYEIWKKK